MKELAKINKPVTIAQRMKQVFPVQFKELDPQQSTITISQEIMIVCSANGIPQCNDLELGLLVRYILDDTMLGPGDLVKASKFYFKRFTLDAYGMPFNIQMLNKIIKPYTIHQKKEKRRQERDKQLEGKKFVSMPDYVKQNLERLEKK